MAIEQIIQAVLAASPAKRRKFEAVARGEDEKQKTEKKDLRLVSIAQTARTLNLGRNTVYRLIDSKRLDTVDLNGSRKVTMRSIIEFQDGKRPTNEKTAEIIAESKARHAAKKSANGGGDGN